MTARRPPSTAPITPSINAPTLSANGVSRPRAAVVKARPPVSGQPKRSSADAVAMATPLVGRGYSSVGQATCAEANRSGISTKRKFWLRAIPFFVEILICNLISFSLQYLNERTRKNLISIYIYICLLNLFINCIIISRNAKYSYEHFDVKIIDHTNSKIVHKTSTIYFSY